MRDTQGNEAATHDGVWNALEGLRDSTIIHDARRYAADLDARRVWWSSLQRRMFSAWSGAALAGTLSLAGFMLVVPRDAVMETGVGELRRTTLADGSVVTLNTGSKLRIHFSREERVVTLLTGQARFDVAHDSERPFRVAAHGMTVIAVGTAFDVVALPRRTAVTLIEGRVVVEAEPSRRQPASRAVLAPGQQVMLSAGALTRPGPARLDAVLAWQHQLVDLSSMSLSEALDEVNRYSSVKVVLADPTLGRRKVISGIFKAGDVEAVAAAFASYFDLVVSHRNGKEIVLAQPAGT